jgi:hypothetical protein
VYMRNFLLIFIFTLIMASCRDKIVCPAFQSTYILDDSTRMAYYSYVWKLDKASRESYLASAFGNGDSLSVGNSSTLRYYDYVEDIIQPREEVRRSSYGIIKYEPMWLKNYKLKTAPKENILGPEPLREKKLEPIDTGEFIASDFSDSLSTDSTAVVMSDSIQTQTETLTVSLDLTEKKDEVKYLYRYDPDSLNNVEQEYYNKYYGELLIDYAEQRRKQAEKLAIANAAEESSQIQAWPSDSTQTETKGKRSLFKKEKAEETESETSGQEGQQEENEEEEGGGF